MVGRRIEVATTPTKICEVDKKRTVLHVLYILNNSANANNTIGIGDDALYVASPIIVLPPPAANAVDYPWASFYKKDGWEVTKAWYAQADTNTGRVYVNEQFEA